MSVLACDRNNCDHIMCDRLILNRNYYICNDCWDELIQYRNTWPKEMLKTDIENKIREFMHSIPGTHSTQMIFGDEIEEEFNRLTKNNDEE